MEKENDYFDNKTQLFANVVLACILFDNELEDNEKKKKIVTDHHLLQMKGTSLQNHIISIEKSFKLSTADSFHFIIVNLVPKMISILHQLFFWFPNLMRLGMGLSHDDMISHRHLVVIPLINLD